jgi:hypothetical protein
MQSFVIVERKLTVLPHAPIAGKQQYHYDCREKLHKSIEVNKKILREFWPNQNKRF